MSVDDRIVFGKLPSREYSQQILGVGKVWETKESTTKNLILCPVCKGRTMMPSGFYPNDLKSANPMCRTCKGKGII